MGEEDDRLGDEDDIVEFVEARRKRVVTAASKLFRRLADAEQVDRLLCENRGYHRVAGISEKEPDENVCYDCFMGVDKDQQETYRVVPRD